MANHVRKFNWHTAELLYRELGSYDAVARELGVTGPAVRLALDADARAKQRAYASERQRAQRRWVGTCVDCGGPATKPRCGSRNGRCRSCAAAFQTSSVRPDTLLCGCCRQWLPDTEFNSQARAKTRRFKHSVCRPCQAVMKRDWRVRNADRERAVERERARARRAGLRATA